VKTYLILDQALRLSTILGLNHLNDSFEESKLRSTSPYLQAPKTWIELEERRRTFWHLHVCALIGGHLDPWPSLVLRDEDISTLYPTDEESWIFAKKDSISYPSPDGWYARYILAAQSISRAAGTLGINLSTRKNLPSTAEVAAISWKTATLRLELMENPLLEAHSLPYSIAILPLTLTYFVSILLHLPRSHKENPQCPHWVECLKAVRGIIPVVQRLRDDGSNVHPLCYLPLYLTGRIVLYEWSARGDQLGFLRNVIENILDLFAKLNTRMISTMSLSKFGNRLKEILSSLEENITWKTECPCSDQCGWDKQVDDASVNELLSTVHLYAKTVD